MEKLIYALCDPRDGLVHYVGATKDLANRMHYHYRPPQSCSGGQSFAYPWLLELANQGLLPFVEVLQQMDEGTDWEEAERSWIAHFRELDHPLINGTNGGQGTNGRRTYFVSQSMKAHLSHAAREQWKRKTPEERLETLRILSRAAAGNRSRTGQKNSSEMKAKISEGLRKAWAEGRQRKVFTDEQKQKIADGVRRYWATRPDSEKQAAVKRMHAKRWER